MRFSNLSPRTCVTMLIRLGMRQADIARAVGVAPTTISRLTSRDIEVLYTTADKLRDLLEKRSEEFRQTLADLDAELKGEKN